MSKPFRNLVIAAFVVFAFLFVEGKYGRGPHHVNTKPDWGTDVDAALATAKNLGKPVLLEFSATWCGPCKDMEREVFSTQEFQDTAKKFVLVSVDVDKQKGVANRYGVNPIPDMRILDSSGRQISRLEGFTDAYELSETMKRVLAKS